MPTILRSAVRRIAWVTMPTGLVKLITHASGACSRDVAGVARDDRNRADGHGEAGRPHRFLRDDPVRQRDRFVVLASGEAADADAGHDEVGSVERGADFLMRSDLRRREPRACEVRHRLQPPGVDVEERDVVDRESSSDQPVHQQRHAHTAAANDRELHAAPSVRRAHPGSASAQAAMRSRRCLRSSARRRNSPVAMPRADRHRAPVPRETRR